MKAFSLVELIVVTIIVGILAAIALPSYFGNMEQTRAQTAENNLMAISAAEQKYFEDNSAYCTTSTPSSSPCDTSVTALNSNLHLSLATNDSFYSNYSCSAVPGSPISYTCTTHDSADTLTLAGTVVGGVVVGFNVSCAPIGNTCPN